MPYDLTTKVGMNKDRLSPAGRVSSDVSDRLIIWRGTAHAEKCVISAHGVQRLGSRTFDIPVGTKVVFYGPDGASLTDPGMTAISGNKIKPYATAERTCPDYSLSKYQGRHGSEKETYTAIVGEVNYAVDHSDHEYDFVTIRNRVFKTSVNFSDVVATLLGYHPYREIHCSFCRSKWFNSPEHDPMLNK